MRFRITLDPSVLDGLSEPTRSEIIAQLPRELEKTRVRIDIARERIQRAKAEADAFDEWLQVQPETLGLKARIENVVAAFDPRTPFNGKKRI